MKAGNAITLVLVGGCVVLAAAAGLFASGWSGDIEPLPPAQARALALQDMSSVEAFDLGDVEQYAEIGERPLFEADRRPPPPEIDEGSSGGEEDLAPPEPLDVVIGGIIVAGEMKLALLTDNKSRETMRVREGGHLEGDLADWVLASIEPRKLRFEGGGEPVEMELQVHNETITPVAKPIATSTATEAAENSTTRAAGSDANASAGDRAARAEEIRRRVAERREQLRQQAAERRAQARENNDQ